MNWFTMAVAGGMLATHLLEPQDQPRPVQPRPPAAEGTENKEPVRVKLTFQPPPAARPTPEARRDGATRPDQPRPVDRRPDQPRPEGRPDQPRPEGRPDQPRPVDRRPDQPRPEGRPDQPRPEGRRPDQPRPEGDRRPDARGEERERAEQRERAQQHVNRIRQEMENHAKAIQELSAQLMRANRELGMAGGQPQPGGPRLMMFQNQTGAGGTSTEKRVQIEIVGSDGKREFQFKPHVTGSGFGAGAGASGSSNRGPMAQPPGPGPETFRRLENLERRLDEVMKRLEQLNRDRR